jgi:MFS family permease
MTPQRLTMLVFFLQPLAFGSWLPRIPEMQQRLGLGPQDLAFALLGLPIGILLTLPFAGPLVGRIGGRAAIRYGFPAFFVAVCLPGFAGNSFWLFGGLLLSGVAMSTLELGLNITADEVEKATGKAIMSTCHGCWSLGITTGSVLGAGFAALALAPQFGVLVVAVLVLPVALLAARALPIDPVADPATAPAAPSRLFVPGPLLMGICAFAFGGTLVEGATADWSAIYLRQAFGVDVAAAGIGYSAFAVMVAAGRFGGDWMKTRWGPVAVAQGCAIAALLGVGLVLLSLNYPVTLFGFALAGFGVSVAFPLAVTAAAGVGDCPAAANVAMLSLVALLGFLLGPPVIGFIAEHLGLRLGLAILVPGLLASVVLARTLQPRQAVPVGTNPVPGIADMVP